MTQCQLVLNHIRRHGYISPLIAKNYGVDRLASRVYDLNVAFRNAGSNHRIVKSMQRDDRGKRYARYTEAGTETGRIAA